MKVAIIYNKDSNGVINQFGMQNKEIYNPNTVKLVADSLEQGGHNVRIIDGGMDVIEKLKEFMPKVLEGERMGMVFNMAYGIQGENRYTHLPAMMEMLGIPYVGSGPGGHTLALDKVITKIIMLKNGIPTPHFWVYSTGKEDMGDVEYPVIVKPKMEAVSYGLRVVHNEADLREAVRFVISEFNQQALVEQFIRGREFCVGLLGNGEPETFPVLEIDLENDPDAIQTVDDKKAKPRRKICPANISSGLADEMIKMSKNAFKALGLSDFSRVDIRMDDNENIYLLEINSMASLGQTGSFVYAANVAGYDFPGLANKMLEVAAVRYFSESILYPDKASESPMNKLPLSVRIRGFLRLKQDETEALLEKMVNINTHVRNAEGVNKCGALIWKQLNTLGFTYTAMPHPEIGNTLLFSNSSDDSYDVLLVGHLDNSTPYKKQVHFKSTELKLYGSGIWDDKSGLAVMITALRALRFVRLLRKIKIGILLTTDNTLQGRILKSTIQEISKKSRAIIGLSGASLDGAVTTSRSGAAVYNCQMNLINSENAQDVANAIASFSQLLTQISRLSSEADGIVAIPREVNMSSGVSDFFADCEASISVRFNNPEQAEVLEQKMRSIVKKMNTSKQSFQIEGGIRRNSMRYNEKTEDMHNLIKDIANRLDLRVLQEHRWNSSDICAVEQDIAMIDGFGALGDGPYGSAEYILRYSLLDRAALLALLLYELRSKD